MNDLEFRVVKEVVFEIKFEIEKLVIAGMFFEQAKSEAISAHHFVGIAQTHRRSIISVVDDITTADLQQAARNAVDARAYKDVLEVNGSKDTWWRRWIFFNTSLIV